ncbi:hypothetical protein GGS24DRAFT_483666 [Hypoxylon argillaceum]|nr:hypothetical protein GGS24DRAFT_483666 [Hypoxylon argillaceum]
MRDKHSQAISKSCMPPGYTSISRLKEHLNRCHTQPKNQCNRCHETFKSADGLAAHQRSQVTCNTRTSAAARASTRLIPACWMKLNNICCVRLTHPLRAVTIFVQVFSLSSTASGNPGTLTRLLIVKSMFRLTLSLLNTH